MYFQTGLKVRGIHESYKLLNLVIFNQWVLDLSFSCSFFFLFRAKYIQWIRHAVCVCKVDLLMGKDRSRIDWQAPIQYRVYIRVKRESQLAKWKLRLRWGVILTYIQDLNSHLNVYSYFCASVCKHISLSKIKEIIYVDRYRCLEVVKNMYFITKFFFFFKQFKSQFKLVIGATPIVYI